MKLGAVVSSEMPLDAETKPPHTTNINNVVPRKLKISHSVELH